MRQYVLDARTATPHFPGIGRYVGNLARALGPQLRGDERLTVLHDPAHPVAVGGNAATTLIPMDASPFGLAQQTGIPRLLRELGADVYHSAYLLMPYRPGAPTALTVYDLIPLLLPGQSSARAWWFFRAAMRMALRAARQVIAISEATRADLLAHFRVAPERVTVIPLAADPAFGPQPEARVAEVRQRLGLPERYVLYLGSNKPHKNLAGLIEAWGRLAGRPEAEGYRLVIAGAWDDRYGPPRVEEARVQWLGPAQEADLPVLYSGAGLFVFPSLYEGFGLPVLEAMACAAPVVCGEGSSLPEAAGDAALRVDASDVGALAEGIARALGDDALRAGMRTRGIAQAGRFSWERTAAQTLEVYRAMG